MNFSPNKTPIEEVIKEGVGGTYFRDIFSGINEKRYKNSWKELVPLIILMQSFMRQIIMM